MFWHLPIYLQCPELQDVPWGRVCICRNVSFPFFWQSWTSRKNPADPQSSPLHPHPHLDSVKTINYLDFFGKVNSGKQQELLDRNKFKLFILFFLLVHWIHIKNYITLCATLHLCHQFLSIFYWSNSGYWTQKCIQSGNIHSIILDVNAFKQSLQNFPFNSPQHKVDKNLMLSLLLPWKLNRNLYDTGSDGLDSLHAVIN